MFLKKKFLGYFYLFFCILSLSIGMMPLLANSNDLSRGSNNSIDNSSKPSIQNEGDYKVEPGVDPILFKKLIGHVPAALKTSQPVKPMETGMRLNLSIVLTLNQEDLLDKTLLELYDIQSERYHQFLSSEEFVKNFAPTEEQVNEVKTFLNSYGITFESVDPNRLIIHASGQVKDINSAFHTEIFYYTDNFGNSFHAPQYELQVPQGLPIQAVHGLENRIKLVPHHIKMNSNQKTIEGGTGPAGGLSPKDIKSAYSLSANLDGSGQVLGLFELDGYQASDILFYENYFGLPHVPLKNVLVDNFSGKPGSGADEVTLDIELMTALAPGAKTIIVYEGPNTGAGVIDTYNRIATDNQAKSVSTSWGLAETLTSGSFITSENTIFKQMAAQGQSIYAASGDAGAYDDGQKLSVDDPASQPYIAGVGGTELRTSNQGSYQSETTWSDNYGAGGGGISKIWTIPSWQKGLANSQNKLSTTMRNVPDVALNAAPTSAYAIYNNGKWNLYGGTSCAAPLWAAFTALVNQKLASMNENNLGFPNPTLYKIGTSGSYSSNFHDIHDGSTNKYYPAVNGYDDATGWGSFIGDSLISTLTQSPQPCPSPSPSPSPSPVPTGNFHIKISPRNAIFNAYSNQYAVFNIFVKKGGQLIPNYPVNVTIMGPKSFTRTYQTNTQGDAKVGLLLNQSFPIGIYKLVATVGTGANTAMATTFFFLI